jgi:predicted transcriptional regulator
MNDKYPKRVREPVKYVLVSPETHAELKSYAQKNGYNMQGVADEAIQEYLKRKEQQ